MKRQPQSFVIKKFGNGWLTETNLHRKNANEDRGLKNSTLEIIIRRHQILQNVQQMRPVEQQEVRLKCDRRLEYIFVSGKKYVQDSSCEMETCEKKCA